jgi:YD repeat-containing protein
MLGNQIHNYKFISLLGEGGMANVYLAENQVLGNQVALKLLKEEFVQHPNIRKRFLAEARNLAQMSHPNVIKVTDLIDAGDIVAFVMEYIEGETLEHYIERKGKLPVEEIETLFKQMMEAIEYVHSQGFIHRDIKPSNFILTKGGSIKLLDFGIAKNTNDSAVDYTKTGLMQQMGTPMYMSPEQVKNTSEVTKETDIYSLGVVLWQMVTGQKPYDSNTLSLPEIQVAILKDALPLTNSVWDELIQKLMNKNIKSRFLSVQDISNFEIPILKNPNMDVLNNKSVKIQSGINIKTNKNYFEIIIKEIVSISKKVSVKNVIILSISLSFFIAIYYYLNVYQISNPNKLSNSLDDMGLYGNVKCIKEIYNSDPAELNRYSSGLLLYIISTEIYFFDKKGNIVSEMYSGIFKYRNHKLTERNIKYKNFYDEKNQLIKVSYNENLNEKWTKYFYQNGYLIKEESNSPKSTDEYFYDKQGNLIERKWNNGHKKYTYNEKNQCTSTIFVYEGKLDSKEFNTYLNDKVVKSTEFRYNGKKITSKTVKKYNKYGDEISLITTYSSNIKPDIEETVYKYDKFGNWIEKSFFSVNKSNKKLLEFITKREIEYFE